MSLPTASGAFLSGRSPTSLLADCLEFRNSLGCQSAVGTPAPAALVPMGEAFAVLCRAICLPLDLVEARQPELFHALPLQAELQEMDFWDTRPTPWTCPQAAAARSTSFQCLVLSSGVPTSSNGCTVGVARCFASICNVTLLPPFCSVCCNRQRLKTLQKKIVSGTFLPATWPAPLSGRLSSTLEFAWQASAGG